MIRSPIRLQGEGTGTGLRSVRRPGCNLLAEVQHGPGAMTIEIRLLGRFSALRDGEEIPPGAFGGKLGRTLVRILLTRRGEYVSRDLLIEELWPARAPINPGANLSVLVNRARKALGDSSVILTGAGGYSFVPGDGCDVDAERFLAEVAAGHRARADGQPVAALARFLSALQAWGGEPLAEDAYHDWAQEYRTRLSRAHLEALENGAQAALEIGDAGQAVALAELAAAREPLREAAHLLLIRALAAGGDKAAALAALDTARRRFSEELGLDLSRELRELQARILRGDPMPRTLGGAASTPVVRVSAPPAFEELPFVGRDAEMESVLAAVAGPRPRIVVVSGAAGTGKSRLLAEVAARSPAPVLGARAFLAERDEAWGLARSLLRAALGLDLEAARTLPSRAAHVLSDLIPEIEDIRPVAHPVVDPESRRALALEGALRLVEASASQGAVVLVDDLQWADATSLVLLSHVVQRVVPLSLILAYRPEEVSAYSPLAGFFAQLRPPGGTMSSISLGPLLPDVIAQLFVEADLASAIAEESDGTPLAVSEVVRGLAAKGLIERGVGGRWRARGEAAIRVAREAARAGQRRAFQNRAREQPARRREILVMLALLGRETPARVVAAASGVELAAVLKDLDDLAGAGLVRLGERGWAAAHDVVADSLVESVSAPERGRLQGSLAAALRAEGCDAAELAQHLAGAGDPDAAAEAYSEAARQRLELYASAEAERLANAGLALRPGRTLNTELLDLRAEARCRSGDLAGAREDLRAALSGKRTGAERSRILARMAMLASGSEDIARAAELVEVALAEAGDEAEARAEVLFVGAIVDMNSSQLDRSRARLDEALALFQRLGNGRRVATILDARGMASFLGGNIRHAVKEFDRVAILFMETGDLLGAVSARGSRGCCLAMMDRQPEALSDTQEAIDLARSLGDPQNEAFALCYRAQALAALARSAEATETALAALSIGEHLGHRELTSASLRALGIARRSEGELGQAESALRRALDVAGENIPVFASRASAQLAQVLIARGELEESEAFVRHSLKVGPPLCRYEALLAQAELAAARGEVDARALAAEALAVAEWGGYLVIAPRLRQLAT